MAPDMPFRIPHKVSRTQRSKVFFDYDNIVDGRVNDFGSSTGSSVSNNSINYAADDSSASGSVDATPSQTLVSFTPDGTPTHITNADFMARVVRHFNISATDKFFDDQIPEDVNARFPVIEHKHNHDLDFLAAPDTPSAPVLSAAEIDTQPPKRLNLVGRYSLSPTRFLDNLSSPFRWSAARSDEAVEDVGLAWKDFIIAYVTILVVIGCFLVIMLDGIRWVLGLFWRAFCEIMDKLLMLD